MPSNLHLLAQSAHHEVRHEFEEAWLMQVDGTRRTRIGDFYGDPNCAIIGADEQWYAVGGQGLIVHVIEEPLVADRGGQPLCHQAELGRGRDGAWWVESLRQTGPMEIEVVLESGATHRVAFTRSAEGMALQVR